MTENGTTSHNIVCFGEVLWDLLPTGDKPGGAPMNVAYHLRKLGQRPVLISRVGMDARGEELIKLLRGMGLPVAYIQVDPALPTGIVPATPNEKGEMRYEIVAPVAWDNIGWQDAFHRLATDASHLVFGSLAARSEKSRETLYQLLALARTKVLDINLRPPHYDPVIVADLLKQADIVKMNAEELELISGWYGGNGNLAARMELLCNLFELATLIVTRGAEGAAVTVAGRLYEHPGFTVRVADTVGSGDSFLAAWISQTIGGAAPEQALAFACGLGSLVASKEGGCPDYDISHILQ